MRVILASQSPRRKELMQLLGVAFEVQAAQVDENMDPDKPAQQEVARVSLKKALAVPHTPEDVVIAADTIVVCDGKVLGKPKDEDDAFRMLTLLCAREHQVMTGLSVLHAGRQVSCTEVTQVQFANITQAQIRKYIATKEPMDKAGSYAIQGGAALFVERICGDYFNVVGLPVCKLGSILREIAPECMEEGQ